MASWPKSFRHRCHIRADAARVWISTVAQPAGRAGPGNPLLPGGFPARQHAGRKVVYA